MAVSRCENGHVYNSSKYEACPYCDNTNLEKGGNAGEETTNASKSHGNNGKERVHPMDSASFDEDRTMAYWVKDIDVDPVVGWLVCIDGHDKGKDFKIKGEKNFIGRGENMDISIQGDNAISRSKHAIISYNQKDRSFMLIPGEGTGIVYVNDAPVYVPMKMESYNQIEMGNSRFLFVAFCGANFDWPMD